MPQRRALYRSRDRVINAEQWNLPPGERTYERRCRMDGMYYPITMEFFRHDRSNILGFQTICRNCARRLDADRRAERYANASNVTPRILSGDDGSGNADQRTGRAFGVELEMTGPSASQIIRALIDAGVPMESHNAMTLEERGYNATNTEANVWTLKHDSSVNGRGLELVSPKLRGEAGFNALRVVCGVLQGIGATVDRSCGLHVHHDMRGLEFESIKRQVLMFLQREHLIARMVAPSRRNNGEYCPVWGERNRRFFEETTNVHQLAGGPRGSINTWAYAVHGSVEVRFHAGTTRFEKIAAWVRFGQSLFAAAEAGARVSLDDVTQMLTDLVPFGLTLEDASWLLRFETAGSRAQARENVERLVRELDISESVLEEV